MSLRLVAILLAVGFSGPPPFAIAHQTYNLAGYDAALPGSINGADGQPAAGPSSVWTNGAVTGYAGALPAMWYAGMHDTTTARTIETGTLPAPAPQSLLGQVEAYNAAADPDLPTDRVLAVGGKSWSDPDNAGQGWGHGLDYGLIHFEPVDELLAGGPVRFTITLTDDPHDDVSVRLAFALYAGWDTSDSSSRHQTFVTDPLPENAPLGAAGLTLLGHAVATAPGEPVSRTFTLTPSSNGRYTVLIGALGGVAGRYRLEITPESHDDELAQCRAELAEALTARQAAEAALATATADDDGDGRHNRDDACAGTAAGAVVDASGCSLEQFCGGIDVSSRAGQKQCRRADWRNDEPLMKRGETDCRVSKTPRRCQPAS